MAAARPGLDAPTHASTQTATSARPARAAGMAVEAWCALLGTAPSRASLPPVRGLAGPSSSAQALCSCPGLPLPSLFTNHTSPAKLFVTPRPPMDPPHGVAALSGFPCYSRAIAAPARNPLTVTTVVHHAVARSAGLTFEHVTRRQGGQKKRTDLSCRVLNAWCAHNRETGGMGGRASRATPGSATRRR